MKIFINRKLLMFVYLVSIWPVIAQARQTPADNPTLYFTKLQYFLHECNQPAVAGDSALYYIHKLGANPMFKVLLQDFLQNQLAGVFHDVDVSDRKWLTGKEILNRMLNDTSRQLVESVRPMGYWVKIKENAGDVPAIQQLTDQFIEKELQHAEQYKSRTLRYAFLIFQQLDTVQVLKVSAQSLLATSTRLLEQRINNPTGNPAQEMAWYGYLYAYGNAVVANQLVSTGNIIEAEKHFKTAADYSSDSLAIFYYPAYYYDMRMLLNEEKKSFREDYVNFLIIHDTDKEKILSAFAVLAMTDTKHKMALKQYYIRHFSAAGDFTAWWLNTLNKANKETPAFNLTLLNGTSFSPSIHQGKWILIDFWGTWCSPCVAELPEMEEFYRSLGKNNQHLVICAVACRDNEPDVKSFLTKHAYTFPVAMSDNQIEHHFPVRGYPTKILITPQGKYIPIPFSDHWLEDVKNYTDL